MRATLPSKSRPKVTRCHLKEVRKALILAAGYGTRLLPATKSQPKEMLPLIDRPIIHYAVEEAVNSGIKDVIIVTSIGKRAVEDYFDRSRDIEDLLRSKGDAARLEEVMAISEMANFAYVRQGEMGGIGHAVMTAKHLIDDDEPFVLFLPDDVIVGDPPATQELINCYQQHHTSVVAVEEVPLSETSSYGIVVGDKLDDRVMKLNKLVEKPRPGTVDSNLAIVGRYLLTPSIFDAIERTARGYNGELQITDALQILANEEGMYALTFAGDRYDTGRPLSLLQASVSMGLKHPEIGSAFREFLRGLDLSEK